MKKRRFTATDTKAQITPFISNASGQIIVKLQERHKVQWKENIWIMHTNNCDIISSTIVLTLMRSSWSYCRAAWGQHDRLQSTSEEFFFPSSVSWTRQTQHLPTSLNVRSQILDRELLATSLEPKGYPTSSFGLWIRVDELPLVSLEAGGRWKCHLGQPRRRADLHKTQ